MDGWIVLFVLVGGLLPSFVLSWLGVGWILRSAERLGFMDKPGQRKVHSRPVPLGGGLGIWLGMTGTLLLGSLAIITLQSVGGAGLLPTAVAQHLDGLRSTMGEIWMIVGCGTVLVAVGLVDDRRGLPWWLRLLFEFLVAGICVYGLGLKFTVFVDLPWFTGLLSVLWIVTLINSFNMLDNMDGLSSGVATISASALGLMLLISPGSPAGAQIFVALLMMILIGALLGFLRYNWPPAKIFMGDAGSYWVGYWMAIGTLLATYTEFKDQRAHAVLAPLAILAIPLYDTFSVIIIRLREGRSPFEGDQRHFSHRLVELGMSKKRAVLTIYLATAACSLGALLLPIVDWPGAIVIILQCLLVLGLICVLENVKRS
jgi:UDP-GlcNAc:undecaprenyl-phosphate GlcNAc-1-phosphate transferase